MRTMTAVLLLAGLATPAGASGGISCEASGGPVGLTIEAGVTRGMGGPLFSFEATANTGDDRVPADLRTVAFSPANVAQYWLDAEDLRLVLYREREGGADHAEITITIHAKPAEGGAYDGVYRAVVYDIAAGGGPIELAGDISCQVE